MALTSNGRLIGRAAASELADFRSELFEREEMRRQAKSQEWFSWLNALKTLDPEWEPWYDAQPEQTVKQMLPKIQDRVKQLLTA